MKAASKLLNVSVFDLTGKSLDAIAKKKGVSTETFLTAFGKPLSPRDFGEYVIALLTDPKYDNATAVGIHGETGVELLAA